MALRRQPRLESHRRMSEFLARQQKEATNPRVVATTQVVVRTTVTQPVRTPVTRVTTSAVIVKPTTSTVPPIVKPTVIALASSSNPVPTTLPTTSSAVVKAVPSSTVVSTTRAATTRAKAAATSAATKTKTSATATPVAESGSSVHKGAVAGGVIGGIAILALFSFAVVFYMRRFQKRKESIAFQASAFRRSAILLDDSKSDLNGSNTNNVTLPPPPPMIEQHSFSNVHPFAPQFQYPATPTNPNPGFYGSYDQQPYSTGQHNLRIDTALPPAPAAKPTLPPSAAAMVAAAAYGPNHTSYSPTHQRSASPTSIRSEAISYLPNPYASPEEETQYPYTSTPTLARQPQPSPPSSALTREQITPSPVYGMHGQYVDMTRSSSIPSPARETTTPTTTKSTRSKRRFVIQNPGPEDEVQQQTVAPSSQVGNGGKNEAAIDKKRPETVYSTIYNAEDAYGGI